MESISIKTIRDNPDFSSAVRRIVADIVEQHKRVWIFNRVINDRGRFLLAIAILSLHFEGLHEGPEKGLTAGRLKTLCVEEDICSAGRAGALLSALLQLGLVAPLHARDGRVRAFQATKSFLELNRERWTSVFIGMGDLLDDRDNLVRRLSDERFIARLLDSLRKRYQSGFRLADAAPVLSQFIERDAGLMIAFALVAAIPRNADNGVTSLTLSSLANVFSVSRSHVLGLMRVAECGGLTARQDDGRLVVLPPLVACVEDFVGMAFCLIQAAIRDALSVPDDRYRVDGNRLTRILIADDLPVT